MDGAQEFTGPTGARAVIAKKGDGALVALSSVCPHLGCQVHWEAPKNRFLCPCHNGTFNAEGAPTGGPPKDAGQALLQFPIKVVDGLLFIKMPVESLV